MLPLWTGYGSSDNNSIDRGTEAEFPSPYGEVKLERENQLQIGEGALSFPSPYGEVKLERSRLPLKPRL